MPQAQPSQPAVAAEAPKPAAIPAGAAAPSVTPPAAPAPVAAPAPAQPPAAAPAPAQPQAAAASVHEAEATLASARATLIEAESERDQLAREARRARELRTQNPNLVSQEAVEAAESRAAQAEVRARAQAARVDAAQAGLRLAQASLENTVIRAQPAAAPGPAPQTPPAEEGVSAGLAMPEFTGGSDDDRLEYARRMATMLDSTIVTLIAVFRGTSGQPFGGATSPAVLSPRERTRWSRCRDLQLDLTTYATAASLLKDSLPANPLLRRAAAMLDTAFAELDATAECDNISSMISAPERWSPWQEHYEAAARHFYESWYAQLRTVHERDRVFARTLNSVLPAALQIRVPPALPPNPPYAGAAPR
ncbi:MAG: hypothetical protein HYR48_01610 [Gemmatimonadetes bacterium]|nr:hypothetical protein [Gemmatimonadota bacterium]